MRILCLQTGVVREREAAKGIARYLWAPWRDECLPVNAFLVEHPEGVCLFDVGQTARAADPGYFPGWHPYFRLAKFELEPEDEAVAHLHAAGFDPTDVRWVVLSHLHTDHVGGLGPFRHAEVLVSRIEWERSRGLAGKTRGYLPQHWPPGLAPTLLALDGGGFGPFPAAHDVAADGTLLVVATPGHTAGHVSLLVTRSEAPVLLGGDLAHDSAELERAASVVARYCRQEGIGYVGAHDWEAPSKVAAVSDDVAR